MALVLCPLLRLETDVQKRSVKVWILQWIQCPFFTLIGNISQILKCSQFTVENTFLLQYIEPEEAVIERR